MSVPKEVYSSATCIYPVHICAIYAGGVCILADLYNSVDVSGHTPLGIDTHNRAYTHAQDSLASTRI